MYEIAISSMVKSFYKIVSLDGIQDFMEVLPLDQGLYSTLY